VPDFDLEHQIHDTLLASLPALRQTGPANPAARSPSLAIRTHNQAIWFIQVHAHSLRLLPHIACLSSRATAVNRIREVGITVAAGSEIIKLCEPFVDGMQRLPRLYRPQIQYLLQNSVALFFLIMVYNFHPHGAVCRESFYKGCDLMKQSMGEPGRQQKYRSFSC
jgi:hypothetical protein